MINTKCVLDEISVYDGLRVSVMSAHSWGKGAVPYMNLTSVPKNSWDIWVQEFAPRKDSLVKYFGDGDWDVFSNDYKNYLRSGDLKLTRLFDYFSLIGESFDLTFLCLEDTPEKCHRRLLAEEFYRRNPSLGLNIR